MGVGRGGGGGERWGGGRKEEGRKIAGGGTQWLNNYNWCQVFITYFYSYIKKGTPQQRVVVHTVPAKARYVFVLVIVGY
jgi:hypothetical protein